MEPNFGYDAVSVWVQDLVPKSDESEVSQMVSEMFTDIVTKTTDI